MIDKSRITCLNNKQVLKGRYVLYWMQAAQRWEYNHALQHAVRCANELKVPVLCVFGICDDYPGANLRHYHFMLDGLAETKAELASRGIKLVIRHCSPELAAIELAQGACRAVVDSGFTRIQRKWRKDASEKIQCLFEEVETNLVVPLKTVSDKEEYAAATIRPKINRLLPQYLVKLRHTEPARSSMNIKVKSFDITDIDRALSRLDIDRSVRPVKDFKAGPAEAKKRLNDFIKNKLDGYEKYRNDPCRDATSNMSPYLHFGQVSPLYIALKVSVSKSRSKDAYLEELIVRRELAYNFVYYNRSYDKFSSLPAWARTTLNFHRADKRQYVYSLDDLENGRTDDKYWNAAQMQMVITGKMHGYMRMYWGKKILEWSKTPRAAFRTALYLNDKYQLDGRDPNGFAGIAWCFGKHDRPWPERQIFGKVRYMNAAGLKRKFDPDSYAEKVAKQHDNNKKQDYGFSNDVL